MATAANEDFGEWLTAPDGTAHYVLAGKCLCGAKVKEFTGPPQRKHFPYTTTPGKIVTPLCQECEYQNFIRWAKKGGKSEHILTRPHYWWYKRAPRTYNPPPRKPTT